MNQPAQHPARELGRTGLSLFPIGLGAMPLSLSGRPDYPAALEVVRAALDAGVNLIDTANAYCLNDSETGHNERLLGRALRDLGAMEKVLVATKGGFTRPGGSWTPDGRPESLQRACEQSLKDLGMECIGLYQFHVPDSRVPYADSIGAMARLQEQGKVRHIGLSNVNTSQIDQALSIVRVESVQNRCSPYDQGDLGNGVLDHCKAKGLTYIPWSPVGGGYGHKRLGQDRALKEIGGKYGVSAYQVALAWLLELGPHVLPIPGASRVSSITDSAAAAALHLSQEDQQTISRI